ncbi:hypothetical protein V6U89_00365 [Micromonospora sp. CPCC 206171]|uniref:hypothetical protein n=1 Tax=Micromonospora sp. CPCC 206171 TaxID=3122405 RepID=UPI002FF161C0
MTVLTELALPPLVEMERMISAVGPDLRIGEPWVVVVVDSPSGAGKPTLVLRAAIELAAGEPMIGIADQRRRNPDERENFPRATLDPPNSYLPRRAEAPMG